MCHSIRNSIALFHVLWLAGVSTVVRSGRVAFLVPVHPPHFDFLIDFAHQLHGCPEAKAAIDLMPVFSSEDHAAEFKSKFHGKYAQHNQNWDPIIVETPSGAYPESWKKLGGLAHLVDNPSDHEFALMLDAEIRILNCKAFSDLSAQLHEKSANKVWFGDEHTEYEDDDNNDDHHDDYVDFNQYMLHASQAITSDLSLLEKQTDQFRVYTWWNDVPHVKLDIASRMFGHWHDRLSKAEGASSFLQNRYTNGTWQASGASSVLDHLIRIQNPLSASELAKKFGHSTSDPQLRLAGTAFEHLMYQMYTVQNEGFTIQDVTSKLNYHGGGDSMGEQFCNLGEEDKRTFINEVHPLWLTGACVDKDLAPEAVLQFHLDRETGT